MGADKTNNIMTLSSGVSQPLLADVQYFELYSSSALNRKLKNIVLPGFYCGFEPVPGTGLSVRITSENSEGKGAASVDVNNVQISVQQIEDVTVSVKAGATNIIVLEANFEHGVKTTQVDSASSVSAARIYARTDNTIGQNQIELCRVIVPSGATAVTKEMIVLKYRVNRAVGVEFSNEISSTEERKAATPLAVKTLHDLVDTKAPINSPNLTGTPTAPTATKGTNNTQIASTAFVMAAIAALVDSSPDALNTLNELAAALGNDPNFATTMTNALAGKQPKDATLTALAELATSADKLPYFTGADRAALTALTSVGRAILGKTSTQGVLDYLGLGEGSALPVGVPVPWPSATPPTGWLKCNGAAFSSEMYPRLAKAYPTLKLPDLRGEFIRGWDDGRGIDPGRQLLGWQKGTLVGGRDDNDDAVDISYMSNGNNIDYGGDKTFSTDYRSDYLWYAILGNVTGRARAVLSGSFFNVTRPRNIAFNYIVRAA
ncbi:tail fiber protein [Salmonella enterica subsp. enterica serovar Enteritidis]|nr:tail fiber protein [Salmonella enterica subsp. enterica serovar Enteritidis]